MLPSIPVQILRQREEKRQILLFGSLNSSNRKLSFRHVTATLSVHLRRFISLKMFPLVLRGLSSKKRRDQIHLLTLKQSYMIVGNYQRRERPSKHCVDIYVLHPFVWNFPDPSRETSFFSVFSALSSFLRSQ